MTPRREHSRVVRPPNINWPHGKHRAMHMGRIIRVTFLRHGRSQADDEGVHEGRYDSQLTGIGRAQAKNRARDFRARGCAFDLIISSPMWRARSTAEIMGQALNVPIEVDEDWMERDNGPLAGMKYEVAAEIYPRPDFRNPYEPICGTGESMWGLYRRASRAVEQMIRRGAGKYLIVAHGGILNAAMSVIIGSPPRSDKWDVAFRFGDLGYAQLVYEPERHIWQLLEFSSDLTSSALLGGYAAR